MRISDVVVLLRAKITALSHHPKSFASAVGLRESRAVTHYQLLTDFQKAVISYCTVQIVAQNTFDGIGIARTISRNLRPRHITAYIGKIIENAAFQTDGIIQIGCGSAIYALNKIGTNAARSRIGHAPTHNQIMVIRRDGGRIVVHIEIFKLAIVA